MNQFEVNCIENLSKKKNRVDSIEKLSKKIKLNPNDYELYLKRGTLFKKDFSLVKSLEDYKIAINLNNKNSESYYLRGKLYYKTWDNTRAIVDLNKAIELKDNIGRYYYTRAKAYKKLYKYIHAIIDLSESIKLELKLKLQNPKLCNYYFLRGECYDNIGLLDKAFSDYNSAISLSDDDNEQKFLYYGRRSKIYLSHFKNKNMFIKDFSSSIKVVNNETIKSMLQEMLIKKIKKFTFFENNKFSKWKKNLFIF